MVSNKKSKEIAITILGLPTKLSSGLWSNFGTSLKQGPSSSFFFFLGYYADSMQFPHILDLIKNGCVRRH